MQYSRLIKIIEHRHPLLSRTAPHLATLQDSAPGQIIGRIALSLLAIGIHDLISPASYSRPFWTLAAFGILVFVGRKSLTHISRLPRLTPTRLLLFAGCHFLLMAVGYRFGNDLSSASHIYSVAGNILSSSKLIVLAPTLILFPMDRKLYRQLSPELFATAVVLFTFFPDRHFELIWPTYSKLLGAAIANICAVFIPGTHITEATDGVVVFGREVDLYLGFSCSGVNGVSLFQVLFGTIVAIEWGRIRGQRALICYALGTIGYLIINALRLVIVFLSGNLVSRIINLNWVLFALSFMVLIRISYEWMVPPNHNDSAAAPTKLNTARC